jgi:hypothetical protein
MRYRVDYPGLRPRELVVVTSMLRGPRLFADTEELKGRSNRFLVDLEEGGQVEVLLRPGLDPVPRVTVGGHAVVLARPLRWHEYAAAALPVLLVFVGGAVGGLIGMLAFVLNTRALRTDAKPLARYALVTAITLLSAVAFLVVAALVSLLLG